MISPKTVQEVMEMARVEDVVQDYVSLKRRGVNMIGLCPFHNEKTPSFTVSPSKNIYKCFGCGQGGGPVQFLMEHERLSFPEAIKSLAKKYGIEIEEKEATPEQLAEQQKVDSLYLVNQYASEFYQDQLFQTDRGRNIALTYFKERGFRESTIREFGLGYAPNEWKALAEAAVQKGYQEDYLKELGLISEKGYDFFRDRVMFPIYNLSGKVLGFGGRILEKKAKSPKYINSRETEIYNKSKILYGAFQAKNGIRQEDECILVEGYTDVISLHQAGVKNVVASSGTSLTTGQIQLIKRYTQNIKILYDADAAGIKAALRGLDLVLEQDMNVKVVLLPEGEDPDSYVQNVGTSAFKKYLSEQAQDFIFFKTSLLLKESEADPVKKVNLVRSLEESIAKIPDPLKRSLYIKECARKLDVEEQLLVNEINKLVAKTFKKQISQKYQTEDRPSGSKLANDLGVQERAPAEPTRPEPTASGSDEYQERDIIRILIQFGGQIFDKQENLTVAEYLLGNLEDVLDDFEVPLHKEIIDICYQHISNGKVLNTTFFTNHEREKISRLAVDLISQPIEYSENWEKKWDIYLNTQKMPEENFSKDSQHALKRFRLKKIVRKCKENQELINQYGKSGEMEKMMLHMKVQQKLMDIRNELANELGTVVL